MVVLAESAAVNGLLQRPIQGMIYQPAIPCEAVELQRNSDSIPHCTLAPRQAKAPDVLLAPFTSGKHNELIGGS